MLVVGLLSDRIGRKRLVILAYALVGVGYALLSFASDNILVFYSYVLLDGIAWGIFFLMFLLINLGRSSTVTNQESLLSNWSYAIHNH